MPTRCFMPPDSCAGFLSIGRRRGRPSSTYFSHVLVDLRAASSRASLLRTAKAMLLRTRQPRHQRVALEHDAALEARAGDLAAVHEHVAGARAVEAGQHVQDGGLAAAASGR